MAKEINSVTELTEIMYPKAVEVGLCPSEFWNMTAREIADTINLRNRKQNTAIYTLAAMVRTAIITAFSDQEFPSAPYSEEEADDESWKRSKAYMAELAKIHKGGKNDGNNN